MRILCGLVVLAVMSLSASAFAASGELQLQMGASSKYSIVGNVATGQETNVTFTIEMKGESAGQAESFKYGPVSETVPLNESVTIESNGIRVVNPEQNVNVLLPVEFSVAPGTDRTQKIVVSTENVRRFMSAELTRRGNALVEAFSGAQNGMSASYRLNVSEMVCVLNENSTQMTCEISMDLVFKAEQAK